MSYPSGGVPEFTGGTELLASQLNAVVDALNSLFPVGAVLYLSGYSGTTTETLIGGVWLEMNGVAVSRTTYSALNTLYSGSSYPFGSGDGSTTFNVPDARGRNLVANASSSGNSDVKTNGNTDGNALASRTPKAAAHTHTIAAHTHTAGTYVVAGTANSAGGATGINLTSTSEAVTGTSGSGGSGTSGSGGAYSGSFVVAGVYVVKAFS